MLVLITLWSVWKRHDKRLAHVWQQRREHVLAIDERQSRLFLGCVCEKPHKLCQIIKKRRTRVAFFWWQVYWSFNSNVKMISLMLPVRVDVIFWCFSSYPLELMKSACFSMKLWCSFSFANSVLYFLFNDNVFLFTVYFFGELCIEGGFVWVWCGALACIIGWTRC